jgi:hypothetical protein
MDRGVAFVGMHLVNLCVDRKVERGDIRLGLLGKPSCGHEHSQISVEELGALPR